MRNTLILVTFFCFLAFNGFAEEKAVETSPDWCVKAEAEDFFLKLPIFKNVSVGDSVKINRTLFEIPSDGAIREAVTRDEILEVVALTDVLPDKREFVEVDQYINGQKIARRNIRGLMQEYGFAGLIVEFPSLKKGKIRKDITVPLLNDKGELEIKTLNYACRFKSDTPHNTETYKDPKNPKDASHLLRYDWLDVVVSPEVPFGIVSYIHQSWSNAAAEAAPSYFREDFKLTEVKTDSGQLLPVPFEVKTEETTKVDEQQ